MRYRFLRFPEGKFKAVTFSYDDGVTADKRLAKLLAERGLKGTFNVNSGLWGKNGRITPAEIREDILQYGHEVAVHGELHRASGVISVADGICDVMNCRVALEQTFGRIVRGMAYPDSGITYFTGDHTYEDVKAYLQALGITYARTLAGDNDRFQLPTDWYAWMPTAHHDNPDVMAYADKFCAINEQDTYNGGRYPRLFYLWGHSYEFDSHENWGHMEALCDKLSGNDDTWYATNGEIYDYVKAWEALEFSADDTMVHNPTATDVWFDADGHLKCVKSGETIIL
ncbi:MAG: polysaccharide deacetylase [Ruminococcaceae bacterium]|nr:polysaccharide deacetylase [Oscillospiraceae bacterium]